MQELVFFIMKIFYVVLTIAVIGGILLIFVKKFKREKGSLSKKDNSNPNNSLK
ncbi:hypothetical protein [Candidatus Francisella endociliophora]|uniref:hypothetical protein n=1 Tax=Candidatus Francisella endociliophora TaxID=653937 RepID=UPI000B236BA2|nr:hypothetical protein [Francisella sp. FSC1006]